MPIPNQSLTILDPGLGTVEPLGNIPLVLGTAEKGTVNQLETVSNKGQVLDLWGQGPLSEAICYMLAAGGGPIRGMRLTGSVAGAAGAVTATLVGTATGTITVAEEPYDRYEVEVVILQTGTLGTGTFKYSLDGGRTFSEEITIPSGGTYVIADTNIELTFVPGAGAVFFEAGDTHTFSTTAPYYSTSDVGDAFDVVALSTLPFSFAVLLGKPPDAAGGVAMFAALATHLSALAADFRYVGGMMDAGDEDTAAILAAYTAAADTRVMAVYGDAVIASQKAIAGMGSPLVSALVPVAGRAKGANGAETLISTDLARTATGPLVGVQSITHDERITEELDAAKITTLRSWVGAAGFYVTRGRIKSGLGSDYTDWQHRRIMDVACKTVYDAQFPFINSGVRTKKNGTIDDRDAIRIEQQVGQALQIALLDPTNAEGTAGHVSAFAYTVDRTNNVLVSGIVQTTVGVRPLGYTRFIETTLGFSANVGE